MSGGIHITGTISRAWTDIPCSDRSTRLDTQDADLVAGRALCLHRSPQSDDVFYASLSREMDYEGGRSRYVHRIVMRAPAGLEVDHINGDTLDNRRHNLRLCSRAENAANRRRIVHPNGLRGIIRVRGKWAARLKVDQRVHSVGLYEDSTVAARVYDAAARFAFGAFAVTNFPAGETPEEARWPLEIFFGDFAYRLSAKGLTAAEIALRANATEETVSRWLAERASGQRPHGGEKPALQADIGRLYGEGLSYGAISRALGLQQSAVHAMAKRMVKAGKLSARPFGQKFLSKGRAAA